MQITLRGLDPELAEHIRKFSREEGIGLNKAAIKLLAEGAGLDRKKRNVIGSDLNHLFGTWDEAEAHQVLESIRSCEQIDEEFWT